ncbi:TIM23 complex component [Borealophlyctis nickersoniae]|nr:TIM23 complex component [Borealophlyctis nickersoniae]
MQDPTMLYVFGAFAVGAVSAVGGILVAGQAWRLLKTREVLRAIDTRDREFFHRIQRHRPKEIAAATPIPGSQGGMPDYYGEKIDSVADYRSWLKKQRKFRIAQKSRFTPTRQ